MRFAGAEQLVRQQLKTRVHRGMGGQLVRGPALHPEAHRLGGLL